MTVYPVTTKQAADLTGISRQSLRVYTKRYSRFLSIDATPAHGEERKFTRDDLRTLRFVYDITSAGRPHDEAIDRLQAGDLEQWQWEPAEPAESAPGGAGASEGESMALVPLQSLQLAQALATDAQRREQEAQRRADELAAENARLLLELGEARGKLSNRYRPPTWWKALFGGAAE